MTKNDFSLLFDSSYQKALEKYANKNAMENMQMKMVKLILVLFP